MATREVVAAVEREAAREGVEGVERVKATTEDEVMAVETRVWLAATCIEAHSLRNPNHIDSHNLHQA